MVAIPRPAKRADWLELRQPFVGASEAAALIGVHPQLTLGMYAARKLSNIDDVESAAMRRGVLLEHGVALMWAEKHPDWEVRQCHDVYQSGPFMATPDRWIDYVGAELTDDDAPRLLEVKTINDYLGDRPPESWVVQCVVQGFCARVDKVDIAALDNSMSLRSFTVDCTTDHSRALIETLLPAAAQFLAYVQEGMIPEGIDFDVDTVKALFPRAVHKTVKVDAAFVREVLAYSEARDRRLAAEKREKQLKDQIAAVMIDADRAEFDNDVIFTWKNDRDSLKVDMRALEADYPDLVASYRRPMPGARKMRIPRAAENLLGALPWANEGDEEDPI